MKMNRRSFVAKSVAALVALPIFGAFAKDKVHGSHPLCISGDHKTLLEDGEWHHITMFDGVTYVDGKKAPLESVRTLVDADAGHHSMWAIKRRPK